MKSSYFTGNVEQSSRILYTATPFAKANLIYLQETGELQSLKPHTSKREKLPSFLFFIIESGTGMAEYEGQVYQLKKGDCVFFDCHKSYSHHSGKDSWKLRWVHFYGANLQAIYEKYLQRGGKPVFHPHDPAPYLTSLKEIFQIAESNDTVRDMHLYEKLTGLLCTIMKEMEQTETTIPAHSMSRHKLQPVKDYLDQHYQERVSLDQLASQFYISKFYLTRIFKEQYGASINAYMIQVRITHAKKLLRFSDLTIEEVGAACGMEDPSYFSRVFRQIEGVTPGNFRKHWAQ